MGGVYALAARWRVMPEIQDYRVVGAWLCLVIGALFLVIAAMPAGKVDGGDK